MQSDPEPDDKDHTYYNIASAEKNKRVSSASFQSRIVAENGDVYAVPMKGHKKGSQKPAIAPKPKGGDKKGSDDAVCADPDPEMFAVDPHTYDSIEHLPTISMSNIKSAVVDADAIAANEEGEFDADYDTIMPADSTLVQGAERYGTQLNNASKQPAQKSAQASLNQSIPDVLSKSHDTRVSKKEDLKPLKKEKKNDTSKADSKQSKKKSSPQLNIESAPVSTVYQSQPHGSSVLAATKTTVMPQSVPEKSTFPETMPVDHVYYNVNDCMQTIESMKKDNLEASVLETPKKRVIVHSRDGSTKDSKASQRNTTELKETGKESKEKGKKAKDKEKESKGSAKEKMKEAKHPSKDKVKESTDVAKKKKEKEIKDKKGIEKKSKEKVLPKTKKEDKKMKNKMESVSRESRDIVSGELEGEDEDVYNVAAPDDPSELVDAQRFVPIPIVSHGNQIGDDYDYAFGHMPPSGVVVVTEGKLSADGSVAAYEEIGRTSHLDLGLEIMENEVYN